MPAGYAHFDFGQQVYRQLDLKLQEQLRNHMDLYNIGVHGPDILFYHQALKKNEVKDLGFSMHQKRQQIFLIMLNILLFIVYIKKILLLIFVDLLLIMF